MAKNRSRRLRKKMHIDEFQELGFSVAWRFPEGTSEEQIDKTVDDFINEVIEPNKLAFDGSGYLAWEGLICMQEIGKCTEEHQAIVRQRLDLSGAGSTDGDACDCRNDPAERSRFPAGSGVPR